MFRHNLIVNLFENGISPCKKEFSELQTKRQILDFHLRDIYFITSDYGIYTIEIASPKKNNDKKQIRTDNIDVEFSKVFTDYIKNTQHLISQRANSMFTIDEFSIFYSYLSILELKKHKVPPQFKHPDIQL